MVRLILGLQGGGDDQACGVECSCPIFYLVWSLSRVLRAGRLCPPA